MVICPCMTISVGRKNDRLSTYRCCLDDCSLRRRLPAVVGDWAATIGRLRAFSTARANAVERLWMRRT
jgi:hypothetical protein